MHFFSKSNYATFAFLDLVFEVQSVMQCDNFIHLIVKRRWLGMCINVEITSLKELVGDA